MRKLILVLASATILASCANEESSNTEVVTNNTTQADPNTNGSNNVSTMPVSEDTAPKAQNVANSPTTENKKAPTSGKINPPHGEPGHDCAIAVGAPLDGSAPKQQAPVQVNAAPVQQKEPTTAKPGQKLNPPHGEPGHDCAKPVGTPL